MLHTPASPLLLLSKLKRKETAIRPQLTRGFNRRTATGIPPSLIMGLCYPMIATISPSDPRRAVSCRLLCLQCVCFSPISWMLNTFLP